MSDWQRLIKYFTIQAEWDLPVWQVFKAKLADLASFLREVHQKLFIFVERNRGLPRRINRASQ
jgi:hypothetical protein